MSESVESNIQDSSSLILPMVVFLRGDEDYFSDFSMNADQVMEALGIKRSRLNQISGRELRVGRTRIDTYVRPVYRKQDVDEYLQWMRPTATHKKSSDLINEARSKLEEQTDKISNELSLRFDNLKEALLPNISAQFFEQKGFNKSLLLGIQKTLRYGFQTLIHRSAFFQKQNLHHWEEIHKRFEEIEVLRKDLEQVKIALVQMNDMGRYSERILLDVQKNQADILKSLQVQNQSLEDLKKVPEEIIDTRPIVRLKRQTRQKSLEYRNHPIPNTATKSPWRRKRKHSL